MKNQVKILIGILIGSILLSGCVTQNKIDNKEVVNVINNNVEKIEATVSEEKLVNNTDFMSTSVNYPILSGLPNKEVEKKLNEQFKQDTLDFAASLENYAKADYENSKKDASYQFIKYEASVEYSVRYNKDNILSIIALYYQYTGGAHGTTNQVCYNIDLSTGKNLLVSDLFSQGFNYKEVLVNEVLAGIEEEQIIYFDDAKQTVQDMNENVRYYIEDGHIVIYYSQYEIAPFASGIPEFKIPFSKLKFKAELGL